MHTLKDFQAPWTQIDVLFHADVQVIFCWAPIQHPGNRENISRFSNSQVLMFHRFTMVYNCHQDLSNVPDRLDCRLPSYFSKHIKTTICMSSEFLSVAIGPPRSKTKFGASWKLPSETQQSWCAPLKSAFSIQMIHSLHPGDLSSSARWVASSLDQK